MDLEKLGPFAAATFASIPQSLVSGHTSVAESKMHGNDVFHSLCVIFNCWRDKINRKLTFVQQTSAQMCNYGLRSRTCMAK